MAARKGSRQIDDNNDGDDDDDDEEEEDDEKTFGGESKPRQGSMFNLPPR